MIRIALFSAVDSDLSGAFAWNKLIEDALKIMSPACLNGEWVIINETWYNPAAFAKWLLHLHELTSGAAAADRGSAGSRRNAPPGGASKPPGVWPWSWRQTACFRLEAVDRKGLIVTPAGCATWQTQPPSARPFQPSTRSKVKGAC